MTTHAIILAAGAASRFGGGKLLVPLRGRPLIAWSIAAALDTRVEGVTVVLGAGGDALALALAGSTDPRLKLIHCPDWAEGIAATLRCGMRSLPEHTSAALIFLGDMPHVSSSIANRLLDHIQDGASAALPECDNHPAHPVAVSQALFPALLALSGDKGARQLLAAMPGTVMVQIDDAGSTVDIDTRDDLLALAGG